MNGYGGRQRGIVAVVVAIGLLGLLAMVGFALDSGHLILNKSRLQNTVDAAALSAAKVLDETGSEAQADSRGTRRVRRQCREPRRARAAS